MLNKMYTTNIKRIFGTHCGDFLSCNFNVRRYRFFICFQCLPFGDQRCRFGLICHVIYEGRINMAGQMWRAMSFMIPVGYEGYEMMDRLFFS